jgi:hypothetical protein
MRNHDTHRPAVELELMVAEGELCVLEDGVGACTAMEFRIADDKRLELENLYFGLDREAREGTDGAAYWQKESDLGHELAAILFPADPANEVSMLLAEHMRTLRKHEYVRLLLSFDVPELANLPWELALWLPPGDEAMSFLGRDRRIALSRFQRGRPGILSKHVLGQDDILSILNIGADPSDDGRRLYDHTSQFIGLIDDHIPRLHSASRPAGGLERYWQDSVAITGQHPEVDIVHWRGHGDSSGVDSGESSKQVLLSPERLYALTREAFLYVVIACESGGAGIAKTAEPSFSTRLLEAGAAAVLGTHDTVGWNEFEYLPIFYPLLFQGVPLDYCVQFLRRFFALANDARETAPFERWYKLNLRTTATWYLDGTPAITPGPRPRRPIESVPALCRQFARLLDQSADAHSDPAARMRRLEAVLKQLQDAEL